MANHRETKIPLVATIGSVLVLATVLALPVFADFSVRDWRFFKTISVPDVQGQEFLVDFVPDRDVFAHAAEGLSDLRIVEVGNHKEVQYKLLNGNPEQQWPSSGAALSYARDLTHVMGQYTSFVVDLEYMRTPHNGIEVRTPSVNFQRRVSVEGSTDGETWTILKQDGQIYDLTIEERNFSTRDTRVLYPDSTVRYLRIRIFNDDDQPIEVVGSLAFFAQQVASLGTDVSVDIIGRKEDTNGRKTLLDLDLGSKGFPTSRLEVVTGEENFFREVRLEGSNDLESWSPLDIMDSVTVWVSDPDVLYSYDTPKFVGTQLSMNYPESTFRYFRLTIFNEDNQPLSIDSAHAHMFVKMVFPVSFGVDYRLYYGNEAARAPSYDLDSVFTYLVTEDLQGVDLGVQMLNPFYSLGPEQFLERYYWIVVSAVALIIGLFLANLLRHVRRRLPPPSTQI